jgi:hypothetical protein
MLILWDLQQFKNEIYAFYDASTIIQFKLLQIKNLANFAAFYGNFEFGN